MRRVVMITGMPAAGKSTLGPLLAARLGPPALRRGLLDTPKRGLWLDTGAMTVPESVEAILADDMAGSRY